MGDPKKPKKKYESPKKMWDKAQVEERRRLTELYGLKNKKEIWKAETILRNKRGTARKLLALEAENRKKREKELLDSLENMGIVKKNSLLDDVLSLTVESILDRRLQSIVYKNGQSATMTQSRQLITHGHITVNEQKVTAPGYIVKKDEETHIGFYDPVLAVKIKQAMHKKKEDKYRPKPGAVEEKKEEIKEAKEEKPADKKEDTKKEVKEQKPADDKKEKPAKEKKGVKKEAPKKEEKKEKIEEAKKEEMPVEKKEKSEEKKEGEAK